MSHVALQRVIVRMLYDPAFVDWVYAEPSKATANCDLEPSERQWLVEPDHRAYRVDPLRRTRSLAGLLEEFPVASAQCVRAQRDESVLDEFFSSEIFHAGMQVGGSLAGLFGEWLQSQASVLLHESATTIETAMASARRQLSTHTSIEPPDNTWRLSPGVIPLTLPARTLAAYSAQLEALRAHPRGELEAVVDRKWSLPDLPLDPARQEGILIDARTSDLRLEPMSAELCGVLAQLESPLSFDGLVGAAAAFGADADDCRGILESFFADGLVQTGPA